MKISILRMLSWPAEGYQSRPHWALFIVAIAPAVYLLTSSPGITTEDSAELAAGARLLTMVHAPGYPLYLLLGRIFSSIDDFPGSGMVLLSVLSGSTAAGLLYWFLDHRFGWIAGIAGATSLIFCSLAWQAATEVEVYSLQLLLNTALFGILFLAEDKISRRLLEMFGLLLGLSLAHHIGLLIHLPAVFLFLAWRLRNHAPSPRVVLSSAGFCAAGLLLYFVLLLLSARGPIPVISWLPITDLSMLFHVATGAGFKRLLFDVPLEEVLMRLSWLPVEFLLSFPLLTALFSLGGVFSAARSAPAWLLLLAAVAVISILHAANYNVLDPERFLFPAIISVCFLAGEGAHFLVRKFSVSSSLCLMVAAITVIAPIAGRLNSGGVLTSRYNTLPVDLGRAVLDAHERRYATTPESEIEAAPDTTSVIWCDWHMFPVLKYLQLVEKRGPNVYIEMDSVPHTPGKHFIPDRTFTMNPSPQLGESFRLEMDALQWKVIPVDSVVRLPELSETSSDSLGIIDGIAVAGCTFPAVVSAGTEIPVTLLFKRIDKESPDTLAGILSITRFGKSRVSVPLYPLQWHIPPPKWKPGACYAETIQTMIPTSHKNETDSGIFGMMLALYTKSSLIRIPLGSLRLSN